LQSGSQSLGDCLLTSRLSTYFVAAPLRDLGPAGGDQAIGIFGGHLDDAILSDGDASAGQGAAAIRANPTAASLWDTERVARLGVPLEAADERR
jgi:hypothetical protein